MQGLHLDKRLSPILESGERITPAITSYIEAGCGFGGIWAGTEPAHESVVDINAKQPLVIDGRRMLDKNKFDRNTGIEV